MVTPMRRDGRLLGFSVEWADAKERLANIDFTAQIAAINRSQVVIEFRPDGTVLTANAAFLKAFGYQLSEIAGQNHAMFLDGAQRAGEGYQRFWTSCAPASSRAASSSAWPRAARPSGSRVPTIRSSTARARSPRS